MITGVWTKWKHELPPLDVTVEGLWRDEPFDKATPTKGKRCKRGCCFDADFGADLVPPTWWRVPDPTDAPQ